MLSFPTLLEATHKLNLAPDGSRDNALQLVCCLALYHNQPHKLRRFLGHPKNQKLIFFKCSDKNEAFYLQKV